MNGLQFLYVLLTYLTIFIRIVYFVCTIYLKIAENSKINLPDLEKRVGVIKKSSNDFFNILFGLILLYNFNPFYKLADKIDGSTKTILFAYGLSIIAGLFI